MGAGRASLSSLAMGRSWLNATSVPSPHSVQAGELSPVPPLSQPEVSEPLAVFTPYPSSQGCHLPQTPLRLCRQPSFATYFATHARGKDLLAVSPQTMWVSRGSCGKRGKVREDALGGDEPDRHGCEQHPEGHCRCSPSGIGVVETANRRMTLPPISKPRVVRIEEGHPKSMPPSEPSRAGNRYLPGGFCAASPLLVQGGVYAKPP